MDGIPTGPAWPGGPEWFAEDTAARLALSDGAEMSITLDGAAWVVEFQPEPAAARDCHYDGPDSTAALDTVASLIRDWRDWHDRDD